MNNSIKTAQSQAGLDFAHTADSRPTALNRTKKFILTLLALLTICATGAWAQEEQLLVTINSSENTDFISGSKTFDDIATVTFSDDVNYDSSQGWCAPSNKQRTATVTAAEGYTVTRVKFYNKSNSAFDDEAPFEATILNLFNANMLSINNNSIGSGGLAKIEVYGYASTPLMTLNEASTEATMEMPASDVTVTYELVRDLTTQVTFGGIPTGDGLVVKNNGTAYEFVTAPTFTLTDALADNADIISDEGITLTTQKKGDGDTWQTLDASALAAGYAPGTYRLVATATADGPYDGTIYSAEFTTVEKYDLLIQPADDYSKGKLSEVTVAGAAQTLDADGKATVPNVAPGAEVKLKANRGYVIEKVEAKKPVTSAIVNPQVGQIIGSDGNNYAADATLPSGVTAVAKIVYVGSNTGDATYKHGLALALADENTNGMAWEAAKTACSGKTAITGASWMLPSKAQWQTMGPGGPNLQQRSYWSSTEVEGKSAYAWAFHFLFSDWVQVQKTDTTLLVRAVLAF